MRSDAGWSSLVARRAHNPKVAGSNPAPAIQESPANRGVFCCLEQLGDFGHCSNFCFNLRAGPVGDRNSGSFSERIGPSPTSRAGDLRGRNLAACVTGSTSPRGEMLEVKPKHRDSCLFCGEHANSIRVRGGDPAQLPVRQFAAPSPARRRSWLLRRLLSSEPDGTGLGPCGRPIP
jgi:hypothetical protein